MVLVLVIAAGLLMLTLLGVQLRMELRDLRTASTDNVQWNMSQLEIELLVFQQAVNAARINGAGQVDLPHLRERFDVLYSRTNTLSTGDVYRDLRSDPEVDAALSDVEAFLDRIVGLIDGADADLIAELDMISAAAADVRPSARTMAIRGIAAFAEKSSNRREHLSVLLLRTSILTGIMIFALGAALFFLFRQFAISEQEGRSLQQTSARLASTVGASLDAVIVANRDGVVIDYNGAAETIFGYRPEEAIGVPLTDLIIPDRHHAAHEAGMKRYLKTGKKRVVDQGLVQLEATRKDGSEFPVEVSIASADGPEGKIFVSFIRDITTRIETAKELTKARDEALSAERAKSNFLAVMSHEMRTPLNGIMGSLDLLGTTELSAQQHSYLAVAKTSGALLLRHVGDVLDISKAEAGQLELHEDVFQPVALIEEVIATNATMAKASANEFDIQNELPSECCLVGDSFRLRQILLNLVSNAIKFTLDGQITIAVTRPDADSDMIEFRVTDTGIGIAEDQIERVFKDFVTVDTGYARRSEGTGLGLGISRRMAEALGGQIGAVSTLGKGSMFWFRVPLKTANPAELDIDRTENDQSAPVDLPQVSPKSVLIVEDNAINRYVLGEMLQRMGHQIAEAHNGQEGLEIANRVPFDAIFMDISMPVMDGVEATQRIRKAGGRSSATRIIGLTAHASDLERERFMQAGMDLVLIKPAGADELQAALEVEETVLGKETGAAWLDLGAISEMQDLLGGKVFQDKLAEFYHEVDAILPTLTPPENDHDAEILRQSVHKLAGSAGVFGADLFREHLQALEVQCRSDDDHPDAEDLGDLWDIWQQTRAGYEDLQAQTESQA